MITVYIRIDGKLAAFQVATQIINEARRAVQQECPGCGIALVVVQGDKK